MGQEENQLPHCRAGPELQNKCFSSVVNKSQVHRCFTDLQIFHVLLKLLFI